ncbi:MAG: START domain-containing protein [Myxococcaceae bacterium]|nr:START domain-containing protein [Myxococcaceae bacterium]
MAHLLFFVLATDPTQWELLQRHDDFSVYSQKAATSPLPPLRGEGDVDAPLEKVLGILLDQPRAREWLDGLEEERLVRREGHAYLEYNKPLLPFFVQQREFLSRVELSFNADSKTIILNSTSVEDAAEPVKPGVIRGRIIASRYELTANDNGTTHVVFEMAVDPLGELPPFLVRFFQRQAPWKTMQGLRRQAARSDVGFPVAFADLEATARRVREGSAQSAARLGN